MVALSERNWPTIRNWPAIGADLGLGLAIVALVLLTAGPLGWRLGWWHYSFAFFWLMPAAAFAALAAAAVSILIIGFGWSYLGGRGLTLAVIGIALGLIVAYVPWYYDRIRKTVRPSTTSPPTPTIRRRSWPRSSRVRPVPTRSLTRPPPLRASSGQLIRTSHPSSLICRLPRGLSGPWMPLGRCPAGPWSTPTRRPGASRPTRPAAGSASPTMWLFGSRRTVRGGAHRHALGEPAGTQ
jgi:hypothetical protein